jgi:hypothetical protein
VALAREAGALGAGGLAKDPPQAVLEADLVAGEGDVRLWILLADGADAAAEVRLTIDGQPVPPATRSGDARYVDLPAGAARRRVRAESAAGLRAAWLVARLGPELPDAGLDGAGAVH